MTDEPSEVVTERQRLGSVLDDLEAHLRKYVYFNSEHDAVAVALFCAATHAFDRAETFPLLAFMSAVRRSGKSRGLEVIEPIVAGAWLVLRPTEAVLFRKIDVVKPTLMIDEVDTIWSERNGHEGLRAILNAGNRPGTTVPRAVAKGKGYELVDFEIYCPKILAGIGKLPETVRDRSIVIQMVRRGAGDPVERLRRKDAWRLGAPFGDALRAQMAKVGALTLDAAALPPELDDRAQDNWESLLAVADFAGGEWPTRARRAAIALSLGRDDADDESLEMLLLRDIRTAFNGVVRLSTTELIDRLVAIDPSPWSDIRGKPLTGHRLARLLRPFKIRPEHDRQGSFYATSQFTDAWARYLRDESPQPSQPPRPSNEA